MQDKPSDRPAAGRAKAGRPRKDEDPAPSRRRVIYVPVELEGRVIAVAEAKGLSYQAAAREALADWVAHYGLKG